MIKDLVLSITNDCNLACKYCFVKKTKNNMSLEIAKQSIDFIFQQQKENEPITIIFFGGEPLLCYESIIIPIVEYCNQQYSDRLYKFSITTNGILLTEDKLQFFKKYNFNILLSIDGDRITQNQNRPYNNITKTDSFTYLNNNLNIILKYFPNITIRGTITPQTVKFLFHNFLFFQKQNIKNVYYFPDMLTDWTEHDLYILKNELEKIMMYYIDSLSNNHLPSTLFTPFEERLYNYTQETFFTSCHKYCGIGDSAITIDYLGDIYACQQSFTYRDNNNNNIYYIGNIKTGIDIDKQNILKSSINIDKKYCHCSSYMKNGDMNLVLPIDSFWHTTLLEEIQLILSLLYINQNDLFYTYFKGDDK